MDEAIINYLEENGLNSITIMFKSRKIFDGTHWICDQNDEGMRVFSEIRRRTDYPIHEANSTRWNTPTQTMMDTFYSVHINHDSFSNPQKTKGILSFVIHLKRKYISPQVYINNIYQVDKTADDLLNYLNKYVQFH